MGSGLRDDNERVDVVVVVIVVVVVVVVVCDDDNGTPSCRVHECAMYECMYVRTYGQVKTATSCWSRRTDQRGA